jgi:hypothetical protein
MQSNLHLHSKHNSKSIVCLFCLCVCLCCCFFFLFLLFILVLPNNHVLRSTTNESVQFATKKHNHLLNKLTNNFHQKINDIPTQNHRVFQVFEFLFVCDLFCVCCVLFCVCLCLFLSVFCFCLFLFDN